MKKNKKIIKIDTIHGINTFFLTKAEKDSKSHEYLGFDGIKISDAHRGYLAKCEDFRAKAKKYFSNNERLKKSVTFKEVVGYEFSEELEKEITEEGLQNMENYLKISNQSAFSDNPNDIYKNFKAKTKRIRIIRDIDKHRSLDFSENVAKGNESWFARYQALSKFIQAARSVILKNRLEKRLLILKRLTVEDIEAMEKEDENEANEFEEIKNEEENETEGLKIEKAVENGSNFMTL